MESGRGDNVYSIWDEDRRGVTQRGGLGNLALHLQWSADTVGVSTLVVVFLVLQLIGRI